MKDDSNNLYQLSHDPHDWPTYTHDTMITKNIWFDYRVVGIIDENKDHYKYLAKWLLKEVDVDSKYWLSDGQLGGHYRIYDGKNSFTLEYIFKLTLEQAQLICNNPQHTIAICNKKGNLYFLGKSYSIEDLTKFINFKQKIESMPTQPKYWKKD